MLGDYERHQDVMMFVEHERLVGETELVMRGVAKFLGIDFEPIMLTPTFNRMIIASDSSFGSKFGIDASSVDRSDAVEPNVRAHFEQKTGAVYRTLKDIAARQFHAYGPRPSDAREKSQSETVTG